MGWGPGCARPLGSAAGSAAALRRGRAAAGAGAGDFGLPWRPGASSRPLFVPRARGKTPPLGGRGGS